MALTLSIDDVAARDRVEFLYDTIWNHVLPVEMTFAPDPADIDVEFRVSQLGPINLSSARSSANALHRTAALVRRDHVPQLFLAVQAAGTTLIEQGGNQAVLRPGDMAVYDSTRPYTVENRERTELHYLRIPRDALALPQRRVDPLLAVRIDAATNPLGAATAAFFTALAASPALDRPEEAAAVADPGVELIRALLAVQAGADDAARGPLEGSLVVRAQQYLRAHLRERDLTPHTIAAAHHVSVRHLHASFERAGISVHATIRELRLEQCRRDLRDPRYAHLAVATVGRRWGFVDPSHFGRAFRERLRPNAERVALLRARMTAPVLTKAPRGDEEMITVVHDVDLAERVRARLADEGEIREVRMFGGLSFMVNGKMAVAVRGEGELLLRVDPDDADELLRRPGAFPAQMGADRVMSKSWLSVSRDATSSDDQLAGWLEAALRFNRKTTNG